jgi:hypothetical protein
VLDLEHFSGNEDERRIFLLAYLMNKMFACKLINKDAHLIIIAAAERIGIYQAIGFQAFSHPMEQLHLMMKLKPEMPVFKEEKSDLLEGRYTNPNICSWSSSCRRLLFCFHPLYK